MSIKLFDSELRVMEILWKEGDTSAKRIAEILKSQIDWSKTTTYTVIKKCIDKGAVSRKDPNFICCAEISKEKIQEVETDILINKLYEGAADKLVASIIGSKRLTTDEISILKKLVEDME